MHYKATDSINGNILNALTPKKDKEKEIITELIACKSIVSTPTLNNTDSTFSYSKQGHIRFSKNWTRRVYTIDLFFNKKNVASFDVCFKI